MFFTFDDGSTKFMLPGGSRSHTAGSFFTGQVDLKFRFGKDQPMASLHAVNPHLGLPSFINDNIVITGHRVMRSSHREELAVLEAGQSKTVTSDGHRLVLSRGADTEHVNLRVDVLS